MPDELDNFFAKKKKDKKKKNALHVGDIAEYLDQSNRHHELEREENEYLQRQTEKEPKEGENGAEDSEWLQAADEDMTTRFAEIGVKDMDASEITEDEEEEEAKVENVAVKTWSTPAEKPVAATPQYSVPTTTKKYVPPVGRSNRRGGANLDLKNEEMFPSIANADKIEKVEKSKVDDRKTAKSNQQQGGGWKTQESKPTTNNAYRPPSMRQSNTVGVVSSSIARPPPPAASTATNTAAASAPSAPVAAAPKTNKYIPPSMRNRQQ